MSPPNQPSTGAALKACLGSPGVIIDLFVKSSWKVRFNVGESARHQLR